MYEVDHIVYDNWTFLNLHNSSYKFVNIFDVVDREFLILPREQIIKNTNGESFWIDLSHEPYNGSDIAIKQCLIEQGHPNFYILTGNLNFFNKLDKHIIFQPQSYFDSRFNIDMVPKIEIDAVRNSQRRFKISCLNGRSRAHRIQNYILLKQKMYFDELLFSMHNQFSEIKEVRESDYINSVNKDIRNQWENVRHALPRHYKNDWSATDDAYTNSYINFVTETSVEGEYWFLSEKVWKPIMAGQLFLLLAQPGSIQHLRDVGIDVFDDLIDHSYDLEPRWQVRLDMIHKEIDRLVTLEWNSIFDQTEERRIANYNYFYSKELYTRYTQHLDPNSINLPEKLIDFV